MKSIKNMGQKGFTIVELLIVIVIIGILAALVFVQFNGMQQRGRDADRKADVRLIESKLAEYYADEGEYPAALAADLAPLEGIPADAHEDQQGNGYGSMYTVTGSGEGYTITVPMEGEDDYVRTN